MDGLKVVRTDEKGRGLYATRNFEVGQVVLQEDPYVHVVERRHAMKACHCCVLGASAGKKLTQCTACRFAWYCSKSCQKKAWKEGHKNECTMLRIMVQIPEDKTRMVARIIWREQRESAGNSFPRVEDMVGDLQLTGSVVEEYALIQWHIRSWFRGDASIEKTVRKTHQLLSAIECNAFRLEDPVQMENIGTGLYLLGSLINHDCDPNCVVMSKGPKLQVRALVPIAAGEEIVISYIDNVHYTADVRNEMLSHKYNFTCRCKACTEGGEREKLKTALASDDLEKSKVEEVERSSRFANERLGMLEQRTHPRLSQRFLPADRRFQQLREETTKALKMQEGVLADTHVYKLEVLRKACELESASGRHEVALQYGERLEQAYRKLLPQCHHVLGLHLRMMGRLKKNCEQFCSALDSLKEAANITSKTHGEDHFTFLQIVDLMKECEDLSSKQRPPSNMESLD